MYLFTMEIIKNITTYNNHEFQITEYIIPY